MNYITLFEYESRYELKKLQSSGVISHESVFLIFFLVELEYRMDWIEPNRKMNLVYNDVFTICHIHARLAIRKFVEQQQGNEI